jgi:hypothetical protein
MFPDAPRMMLDAAQPGSRRSSRLPQLGGYRKSSMLPVGRGGMDERRLSRLHSKHPQQSDGLSRAQRLSLQEIYDQQGKVRLMSTFA